MRVGHEYFPSASVEYPQFDSTHRVLWHVEKAYEVCLSHVPVEPPGPVVQLNRQRQYVGDHTCGVAMDPHRPDRRFRMVVCRIGPKRGSLPKRHVGNYFTGIVREAQAVEHSVVGEAALQES